MPTHRVGCFTRPGATDLLGAVVIAGRPYHLERLVTFRDGWYHEAPPFDAALLRDEGSFLVLPLDRVRFELVAVTPAEW